MAGAFVFASFSEKEGVQEGASFPEDL